ncbi:hypothetical protein OMAG_000019 [Candidatus Omnitrophus magneticus]|uniref:Uncharacterized protein n=1 Tax=Candidatus Omnitrophus magneticus TaxID=1609969 RepID=A0A0F0CS37_9BACT|nr:hypothetical protein OMAG_000019 [Candidatus Omnitrophus magneticus]
MSISLPLLVNQLITRSIRDFIEFTLYEHIFIAILDKNNTL